MIIRNYLGKRGEDFAAAYLRRKGYLILERNYRKQYAEIDIIALSPQKDTLVFFEVKTRSSNEFGTPLESITPWKLRPVIKAAEHYAISHQQLTKNLRIDAISVQINGNKEEIVHEENISGF